MNHLFELLFIDLTESANRYSFTFCSIIRNKLRKCLSSNRLSKLNHCIVTFYPQKIKFSVFFFLMRFQQNSLFLNFFVLFRILPGDHLAFDAFFLEVKINQKLIGFKRHQSFLSYVDMHETMS